MIVYRKNGIARLNIVRFVGSVTNKCLKVPTTANDVDQVVMYIKSAYLNGLNIKPE